MMGFPAFRHVVLVALSLVGPTATAEPFQTVWCKSTLALKDDGVETRHAYDALAVRLHRLLVADQPERNVITSPVSIHLAMAMAMGGAVGKTQVGLTKALALPHAARKDLDKRWYGSQSRMLAHLTCPEDPQPFTLRMANGFFAQKGKAFEAKFVERLRAAFDARPMAIDYAKDPEGARKEINGWVAELTSDKIRDLVAPGQIDKSSRLTLVNALYLNAGWQRPFETDKTSSQSFNLSPTAKIKVPMMERAGNVGDYDYGKVGDTEVVRLKLGDGRLSMTLILPPTSDGLPAVEKALSVKSLAEFESALAQRKVNLSLPKFNATGSFALAKAFQKLGAVDAFHPKKANFKGIDGGKGRLYISDVVHKTYIDVHETGLEGAAATAVVMKLGAAAPPPMEPVTVIVDRPFLFVVRAGSDGTPLLFGRVIDPRATAG